MGRGWQYYGVNKVHAPGTGEKVLLLPLSWVIQHRWQVDTGVLVTPGVVLLRELKTLPEDQRHHVTILTATYLATWCLCTWPA